MPGLSTPPAATVTDANTGLAVVILLDLSSSMTDSGMTSATRFAEAQQVSQFVNDALQDGDLVGVVGFATGIYDGNSMTLQADHSGRRFAAAPDAGNRPQSFQHGAVEAHLHRHAHARRASRCGHA